MLEVPKSFYVFVSGKNKGGVAELYMFGKYSLLAWILRKAREEWSGKREKNSLHKHLEWLLLQGETRQTKVICPFCGQNTVKFFSVLRRDFYPGAICCGNGECRNALRSESGEKWLAVELLPFKFSSMLRFRLEPDQRKLARLFKMAFRLPERLTREDAFKFFSE